MTPKPSTRGTNTVVVHTYNRPDFLEADLSAGRWEGIPLLIADDASTADVQQRLRIVADKANGAFFARTENGGVALSARDGVEAAGTPLVMLCGDDDFLVDYEAFEQQATRLLQDDGVLLVTMPEVRTIEDGRNAGVQYDRRNFDRMTGRQMLHDLVYTGEMKALQAGAMWRRDQMLSRFAEPIFRTSEDYVLLARMCAAYPDAEIRVPNHGAYIRRIHAASLSHGSRASVGRSTLNLLARVLAATLLSEFEPISNDVICGLLRQRGTVLATVYGSGSGVARVLEDLVLGRPLRSESVEQRETIAFLTTIADALPRELAEWRQAIKAETLAGESRGTNSTVQDAGLALDKGDLAEARRHLQAITEPSADVDVAHARLAWSDQSPNAAVRHLSTALVREPKHPNALHLLQQVAEAAGTEDIAIRLRARLTAALDGHDVRDETVDDVRVAFIVSKGLDQFLGDLIRELLPLMDARKFVVESKEDIEAAMAWADICWFEWCNDPIVWASTQEIARSKPIICRLHRYEAFSSMPLKVNWDRVDVLMVVAEHVGELVCELVPGLKHQTRVVHVPNGVDMAKYTLKSREPGYNLALVGYMHGRKNPGLALQIMAELVAIDPRYRLHVAGKFQDHALKLYWSAQVQAMGLSDNVVMHPWQDDIPRFLDGIDYLLSTSTHESFGYTIAEAMACGIKPIVHRFPFADEMWAAEMLFNTVREAVALVRSDEYTSGAYRHFIEEHYSLERQVDSVREALGWVKADAKDNRVIDEILSLAPQTVNAELKCRCPECRSNIDVQVQTIAGLPTGQERCERCGTMLILDESAYCDALSAYEDAASGSPLERHQAMRTIAKTWGDHPTWVDVMTVDGINLAHGMEFELTKHLVTAWLSTSAGKAA